MTDRDQAVIDYLRGRRLLGHAGWADASMIATQNGLGRDGRKVEQSLARLHRLGLVEKTHAAIGWPPEYRAAAW